MWLLFDFFLDGVCDFIINLATVPEVFFDFVGIIHLVAFLYLFILHFVAICINLSLVVLLIIFVDLLFFLFALTLSFVLLKCLHLHFHLVLILLQEDFGTKLLQILVGLFEYLHES